VANKPIVVGAAPSYLSELNTGDLALPSNPTTALGAATKQYVDLRVLKSGDTMTGPLQLPANAVAPLQAVPLQQLQALIPADYISGLKMVWISSTSISVSSGAAILSSTGSLLTNSATLTLTPSLAASTFYHVYLYNNAGTAAIEAVTTAPAAAYFGTARAKTGDTSRRYIGSILTDSSGNIFNFKHVGLKISYLTDLTGVLPFRTLSLGQATILTSVSCSSVIPSTSTLGTIRFTNTDPSYPARFSNSASGLSAPAALLSIPPSVNTSAVTDFPLDASQAIQYFMYNGSSGGSGGAFADVIGYTYER
jgi:hypothetical protein